MKEWKTIEGTNGMIFVSNEGEIGSVLRGSLNILKQQTDNKGYQRVRVTLNRKAVTFKVHREVAKAFISNPLNLPQVNHIDGNKQNNNVSNPEWVTNKENAHHAIRTGLWEKLKEGAAIECERRKTPVLAIMVDEPHTKIRFESISDAERAIGSRHITDVLKGKRSKCKGYTFRYLERR